jgi:hypothetical protein
MTLRASYARCKVAPGYFDTEFYVTLADASAYVGRRNVRLSAAPPATGGEVDGEVLVYIVDESDKDALVEIPGEPAVGGLRTRVAKALLAG